uniref:Uncharacterized protein n=1 Tax=Acrobeloides nanus TaxID=290746 RepID=A0A914BY16_9BILA
MSCKQSFEKSNSDDLPLKKAKIEAISSILDADVLKEICTNLICSYYDEKLERVKNIETSRFKSALINRFCFNSVFDFIQTFRAINVTRNSVSLYDCLRPLHIDDEYVRTTEEPLLNLKGQLNCKLFDHFVHIPFIFFDYMIALRIRGKNGGDELLGHFV